MKFHGLEVDFSALAQLVLAVATLLGAWRAIAIKSSKEEKADVEKSRPKKSPPK